MVDIEKILKERSKKIDKIIEKYIPKKYNKKSLEFAMGKARYEYTIEAPNKVVAEPIWDLLNRGGKRWRPVLMMLVCEALGGNPKKFQDLVVIPEIIHNGTLMIDDIEDSSELRRGKPCTYKIFGIDISINAGNIMYYLPFLVTMRNKIFDEKTKLRIYETYLQEMINISFGQGMDIAWHNGKANADKVTEKEYLQMCAYKTGTLARMSAKIGAIASGADEKTVEAMGKLAESIGVGFQIQDDILNLTATSGKNQFKEEYIGEDIHEGKRTLMVIYAVRKADKKSSKRLIEILNMHTRDRNLINEAIKILRDCGAIDYARQRAKQIVQEAWNEVDPILKPSKAKDMLAAFVKFLVERDY
ncbi:MAG: polyprenyl synthetase family protein [Candidatus Aenigmatarchaeota archaeon]